MSRKGRKRYSQWPACEAKASARGMASVSFRLRAYRSIRMMLIGFIFVSIANVLFSYFFYTPKMYRINRDNYALMIRYRLLQERISQAQRRVNAIRVRDNYVYRALFSTDTLSADGIGQPYPDEKYAYMAGDKFEGLMTDTWKQLDILAKSSYYESLSLDELQLLSKEKEKLSAAIPAIWPIDRANMTSTHIGAFNMRRMHPTLGYVRPHKGVDFGCYRESPIYATGDAVVERTISTRGGYGIMVELNHEFGYKTRYAHLSKILVAPGEHVSRGQVIALSGNTGESSAPHLHYEVIHKGTHVNPINYFNRDMTAQEYKELTEQLRDTNYENL